MRATFHHVTQQNADPQELADITELAFVEGQCRAHALRMPEIKAATVCYLLDDENRVVSRGYSLCSTKDQFEKRKGRLIAEGRARKALEEDIEF